MSKETKSVRFSDSALEAINNYPTSCRDGGDFTSRLEELIQASSVLLEMTKWELKDVFTINEACLIVDTTNSLLYGPQYSPKSSLALSVSDGDIYENLGEKWDVDISALLLKIGALTNYQCHVVFLLCNQFWSIDFSKESRTVQENVAAVFNLKEAASK